MSIGNIGINTCQVCGGLIADPNKIYGYAGKFCHCIKKSLPEKYKERQDDLDKFMMERAKEVKKPSLSHIVNLCEQLSKDELRVLADVIKVMHDLK